MADKRFSILLMKQATLFYEAHAYLNFLKCIMTPSLFIQQIKKIPGLNYRGNIFTACCGCLRGANLSLFQLHA